LGKHAQALAAAGLDRVTVSLDSLDDELRERIAGVWMRRQDRYSEERAAQPGAAGNTPERPRSEMCQVDG
jgi:molybdenum cofactor biosynthesis enzyme MoaA